MVITACKRKPAANVTVNQPVANVAAANTLRDCMLSENDVNSMLGQKVDFIARNDFRLDLSQAEIADKNVRACGFANAQGAYIYWRSNQFPDEKTAEGFYKRTNESFSSADTPEASDYWEDDVRAIVDGGFMTHGYHRNFLRVNISGRVEKIAFQLRSSSPTESKISYVLLKGLAVSISRDLPTTPR